MDDRREDRGTGEGKREVEFAKMGKKENSQSHHYWGGGYHCSSPNKTVHNYQGVEERVSSPTFSFSSDTSGTGEPSSIRDARGRNIYIGLDDYYRLHG